MSREGVIFGLGQYASGCADPRSHRAPQRRASPGDGQQKLNELDLADAGNATQSQAAVPDEKAQEHAEDRDAGQVLDESLGFFLILVARGVLPFLSPSLPKNL